MSSISPKCHIQSVHCTVGPNQVFDLKIDILWTAHTSRESSFFFLCWGFSVFFVLLPPLLEIHITKWWIFGGNTWESFPLVFKIAFVKELLDRVSSHYSCLHVSALSICRECMWLFWRVGVGRCYLECIYSYIPAVTPQRGREGAIGVKSIEVVL